MATLEQKNKFCVGDTLEIMRPCGENTQVKVISIKDDDGRDMDSCPHPQQIIHVKFEGGIPQKYDIIRVEGDSKIKSGQQCLECGE